MNARLQPLIRRRFCSPPRFVGAGNFSPKQNPQPYPAGWATKSNLIPEGFLAWIDMQLISSMRRNTSLQCGPRYAHSIL
jgi:hypothetical protein